MQSALLPIEELLSSYDANFWINLLSKMADSARRSMPCESNFKFSTSKKQSSDTVTVKSESVQNNRVAIEKRSISQHIRNDYSNEKLVTKNDIDNAYNQLMEIISDAYFDISRLKGVNHKFDDIQKEMSHVLEAKVQDAKTVLNQTKNKTVWDNLVIAFFGETNAGKSTIIETFRILFDHNRKKEDGLIVGDGQHDFTKTYSEYQLSISGKPFTLIDVPGIEGKEEDFRDSIKTALQKAHIVFYVNGHNKKPDEATAKKIKNYLGDWVKVYSIYNVRGSVSNYDEEEERETLFTDGVRKNESLIRAEFKRILGDVYVGNLTIQAQLAMCAKASFSAKREDLIRYQQKLLRYFANSPEKALQFSQFQTIINLVDEKSVNFKQEIIEANKQKLISLASRIADDISNTMASQKSYVERLKTNLNVAEREICNNLLNNAQHNISSSVKNMIDSSFGDLKSYAFSCIDKGDSNLSREVEAYQRRRFGKLRNDIAVCVKENLRKIEQTSNRKLRELDGVNIKPLSLHNYLNSAAFFLVR
ncbi:MAG: GTPase domain-containing protein [Lachnospira sp.]